ncbi:carboxymuconolactone decarboxylase family protein [Nocardia sp. NPDC058666]|uniref:carboxymuconolactone decarboxylase family protein n=1 Tax=unclassified Nocardia TaxID=2637762 RepID=UPI00366378A0
MSRLPLVQPETATGRAAQLLADVQKGFGVTPNMTKVMVNSPAVLAGYLALTSALAGGALSAGTRERIALLVAEENGCDYCLSAHSYIGENVAELDHEEIASSRHAGSADDHAKAVLAFTVAVLESRGGVADSDLAQARAAGLTDGEIVEVVAGVALNVFTNYVNKVADTEIDWPVVRHHSH